MNYLLCQHVTHHQPPPTSAEALADRPASDSNSPDSDSESAMSEQRPCILAQIKPGPKTHQGPWPLKENSICASA